MGDVVALPIVDANPETCTFRFAKSGTRCRKSVGHDDGHEDASRRLLAMNPPSEEKSK